ncbi:MAG: hypothetical protein PHU78_04200, partial [Heliobacteriaceae bacterium]|nr:hypothetical protein [Heliobacteriaceae bacterium]
SYDPQKRAFLFNFGSERTRPAYNADNAWDICLNKVTRNNDGTLTVVLVHKGPPQSGRIELTKTYTLKQREDGSLFFVSGRWDFVNNHLVSLTGDYQYYTEITGFAGNMEELAMLGEVDGQPLLANTPYEKGKTASLLLLNPATMHVEKQLDLQAKFEATDVRLTDKIVVCLKDKIITVDQALEETKDLPLPPAIKAKMARKPEYDQYGIPDIFFGGYDVSRDLKTIVYADEIGVKLFNIADNSEKLLAPSVLIEGSKLFNKSYHRHPRFVAHEQKVITIMTAYEGTLGYTLCDLETGTAKTYDISSESSSTGCIRYDSGLLEVNTHLYNREKQTAECKTLYLDFRTGEIKEITLEDPGDTNDIRWPEHCYVGQDYAAFITRKWDSSDPAQSMFYLNRINLKTLQLEPKIISVKAAQTYILGVLADGRILFWYNLNPSENGVCLTK